MTITILKSLAVYPNYNGGYIKTEFLSKGDSKVTGGNAKSEDEEDTEEEEQEEETTEEKIRRSQRRRQRNQLYQRSLAIQRRIFNNNVLIPVVLGKMELVSIRTPAITEIQVWKPSDWIH